jgi:NAD(P)-dependent dehydrogenase (short-subunit alcohol dehydrogenase family)
MDFSSEMAPAKVLEDFKAATHDSLDRVDVLICNAGYVGGMRLSNDTPADELALCFRVNSIAPLILYQALRPLLLKASPPKFIYISSSVGSITAQEPLPGGAYGASRAAGNWLTKSLHAQEEAIGLVAVAVHPGWVKTNAGEIAEKSWNIGVGPNLTVDDSVQQVLKIIDQATRETASGKFLLNTGESYPW